jgi:hypothetical protein
MKQWVFIMAVIRREAFEQIAMFQTVRESAPLCSHQWDGPRIVLSESASVATCSRCGASAVPEVTNPQRPGTPGQGETLDRPSPSVTGTEGETPRR